MEDRSRLQEFQGSHNHLAVLQVQSQPSFGGQRHRSPDQTRQSGMREVAYQDGERSSYEVRKKVYPRRVAVPQRHRTSSSATMACPSERKIIIGALGFKKLQNEAAKMKPDLIYGPLRAPIFHHNALSFAESCHKVCSGASVLSR
jgi:hypothetical protein